MVYSSSLENCRVSNGTVGSNPTLSASFPPIYYNKYMGQTRKQLDAKKNLKNKEVLGTSMSNATMRLLRSLVFDYICRMHDNYCYRCKLPMTRQDFSIEHIKEWRGAENGQELFFDIDNISYSHLKCNTEARRFRAWNKGIITHGISGYRLGCRCETCKTVYSKVRKEKYLRNKT